MRFQRGNLRISKTVWRYRKVCSRFLLFSSGLEIIMVKPCIGVG